MPKAGIQFQKKDEYNTPKEVVDFFGPFDYDPATTKEQAEYLGIPHYDTIETDGLRPDAYWEDYDKIWINPPFTRKSEFLKRAVECYDNGGAFICILLPIEYLTTKEFHRIMEGVGYHLFIPNGRIKFDDGSGKPSSPAFGSCVIEFGSHDLDFTKDKRENTFSHWRLHDN